MITEQDNLRKKEEKNLLNFFYLRVNISSFFTTRKSNILKDVGEVLYSEEGCITTETITYWQNLNDGTALVWSLPLNNISLDGDHSKMQKWVLYLSTTYHYCFVLCTLCINIYMTKLHGFDLEIAWNPIWWIFALVTHELKCLFTYSTYKHLLFI